VRIFPSLLSLPLTFIFFRNEISSNADGQSSSNMTNLALKGILGIKAMGEMSNVAGNQNDAKKYRDQASSYISKWASLAGSSGHLTFTYGEASSFGLMYNLYADKLMGTGLVPSDVSILILVIQNFFLGLAFRNIDFLKYCFP
jgi:hypothetical protein